MLQLNALLAAAAAVLVLGAAPAGLAHAAPAGVQPEQAATPARTPAGASTATPARQPGAAVSFPTATPTAAATSLAAPISTVTSITLTIPGSGEPDVVVLPTATPQPPATPAPAATPTEAVTVTLGSAVTAMVTTTVAPAESFSGAIEGTVIANRTQSLVRYFAEGNTYTLDPLRSTGLALARPTGVLNLFNCDATLGEAQEGCFWDPYLLKQDGFYEIVSGKDAGALVSLILREAGAPPANQIWIQNRTGAGEEVYFGTQMRDLPAGSVQEFAIDSGGVGVFYLRTCITSASGNVCEWAAHSAEPGGYYALVNQSFSGGVPGTTINNLELTPVLSAGQSESPVTAEPQKPQTVCRLAVPALNVRSGPGLEFEIVKKVRSSDVEIATVLVVARTEDGAWLQVDERVATDGWVIAGSEYLNCDGDVLALPIIPVEQLPATPTPLPIVEVPGFAQPAAPAEVLPDQAAIEPSAAVTETATSPAAPDASIPAGLARLTIQNSFDHEMRITLDQRYRVAQGPSEIDLAPGQSTSFVVFPGSIPYTASSPWQGMSGNAEVFLNPDEARALYIFFYYDTLEEKWVMQVD